MKIIKKKAQYPVHTSMLCDNSIKNPDLHPPLSGRVQTLLWHHQQGKAWLSITTHRFKFGYNILLLNIALSCCDDWTEQNYKIRQKMARESSYPSGLRIFLFGLWPNFKVNMIEEMSKMDFKSTTTLVKKASPDYA